MRWPFVRRATLDRERNSFEQRVRQIRVDHREDRARLMSTLDGFLDKAVNVRFGRENGQYCVRVYMDMRFVRLWDGPEEQRVLAKMLAQRVESEVARAHFVEEFR